VIAICGSLRPNSNTRKALEIALKGAAEAGAETQMVDLREYELIFCDGKEDESGYPPDVARLRDDVKSAQGIIIGTPEYHSSFSGVLKNAIDMMSFKEFEGKMIGLLGTSGGAMGALNALNGLRTIGRSLHAWVNPEQVSIAAAWKAFNDDGMLKDADIEKRLLELGRQVTRFSFLHSNEKSLEFLKAWEAAPVNPGAE
jgi:NAD(P)H-dependent FMN reductase